MSRPSQQLNLEGFSPEQFERTAGLGGKAFETWRRKCLAFYEALSTPAASHEMWRRTDPARFNVTGWTLPKKALPAAKIPMAPEDADYDVVVYLTDEGVAIHDVTGMLEHQRVNCGFLDGAQPVEPSWLPELPTDKFSALTAAFANSVLHIEIPEGVYLDRGVLVRSRFEQGGQVQLPLLIVDAGADSQVTVVNQVDPCPGADMLLVPQRFYHCGTGANIQAALINHAGEQVRIVTGDWAVVERDAHFHWAGAMLGGDTVKADLAAVLNGPGAGAALHGIGLIAGRQHVDFSTHQDHRAKQTTSDLKYKTVIDDKAYSIYRGNIKVDHDAIGTDAYQQNNNLLLADGARVDSIPGLEIDANDLRCSHGSTTSDVDEEQIYYLQSRGIEYREAKQMIVEGFLENIIGCWPSDLVCNRVRSILEKNFRRGI